MSRGAHLKVTCTLRLLMVQTLCPGAHIIYMIASRAHVRHVTYYNSSTRLIEPFHACTSSLGHACHTCGHSL